MCQSVLEVTQNAAALLRSFSGVTAAGEAARGTLGVSRITSDISRQLVTAADDQTLQRHGGHFDASDLLNAASDWLWDAFSNREMWTAVVDAATVRRCRCSPQIPVGPEAAERTVAWVFMLHRIRLLQTFQRKLLALHFATWKAETAQLRRSLDEVFSRTHEHGTAFADLGFSVGQTLLEIAEQPSAPVLRAIGEVELDVNPSDPSQTQLQYFGDRYHEDILRVRDTFQLL